MLESGHVKLRIGKKKKTLCQVGFIRTFTGRNRRGQEFLQKGGSLVLQFLLVKEN